MNYTKELKSLKSYWGKYSLVVVVWAHLAIPMDKYAPPPNMNRVNTRTPLPQKRLAGDLHGIG